MRLIGFAFMVLALAVLFAVGWWLGRPGPLPQVLAGVRVELPLKCYPVLPDPPPPDPGENIGVETQFSGSGPTVMEAKLLCAPAVKERKDDVEPVKTMRGDHLHCYQIDGKAAPGRVIVLTQFHGARPIALGPAVYLCEPTDKDRA